jgi:hypothetical protein
VIDREATVDDRANGPACGSNVLLAAVQSGAAGRAAGYQLSPAAVHDGAARRAAGSDDLRPAAADDRKPV